MITILLALSIVAIGAYPLVARFGRSALLLTAIAPALALCGFVMLGFSGLPRAYEIVWLPELQLNFTLLLDQLSWLMSLLICFTATLVLIYSRFYFDADEPGLARFAAFFLGFTVSMLGIVLADNIYLLFIFWESTTVFSFLLIGHYFGQRTSRAAALQALIVTTAGGLVMLVGFVLLSTQAGTANLSEIIASPPAGALTSVAVFMILIGALSKSAIVPFHFWLPGAMAAPTPVSAFLHAAAMVKAGIYLIARISVSFDAIPGFNETIVVLGGATLLLGGVRALRQHDVKLIIAYGTVSQLGLIMMVLGVGDPRATIAGVVLLFAHALAKAPLFLAVGIIDHQTGTRDLRKLSGFGAHAKPLVLITIASSLSMIGAPVFLGFVAKESVFTELLLIGSRDSLAQVAFVVAVAGSVLTVMYMMRFVWGSFATKPGVPAQTELHNDSPRILIAPALFAASTLVFGLAASFTNSLIQPVKPGSGAEKLALWHGVTPALGATVLVFVLGITLGLFALRSSELFPGLPERFSASHVYWLLTRWLDVCAVKLTSLTQRGSLPFYLAVILTVLISTLGGTLLVVGVLPADVVFMTSLAQIPIAVVMMLAAGFAVRARTRFQAIVLVGVTGYGMALVFALHGAPDLALTQALVETVTLIAFVLVIRKLPQHFVQVTTRGHRVIRAVIGLGVGLVFGVFALVAYSARVASPISEFMPEMAYAGGHGFNVVNVMLVDMRGWDTLGELSVILAAATGVASLVFLRTRVDRTAKITRRDQRTRIGELQRKVEDPHIPNQRLAWTLAGHDMSSAKRSILLEVVVRLSFHVLMLVSFYLLLTGHNTPGGGFTAGLVAGLALVSRYLAGGRDELRATVPVDAGRILGSGLALASVIALLPTFFGQAAFSSSWIDLDLGPFGSFSIVTSTLFDVGVYLVVFGLVLDVLRSLGAEIDRQEDQVHTDDESETFDRRGVTR